MLKTFECSALAQQCSVAGRDSCKMHTLPILMLVTHKEDEKILIEF
jgi:hypothetical protein